jgi:hypothetical protein
VLDLVVLGREDLLEELFQEVLSEVAAELGGFEDLLQGEMSFPMSWMS